MRPSRPSDGRAISATKQIISHHVARNERKTTMDHARNRSDSRLKSRTLPCAISKSLIVAAKLQPSPNRPTRIETDFGRHGSHRNYRPCPRTVRLGHHTCRLAETGKLRVCVDHTKLNRYVRRPTHLVRTPRDAVSEIDSDTVYFSCFDAANGYFQIPLDEASQHLTVFMTPWGRYSYLRASIAVTSSIIEQMPPSATNPTPYAS